MGNLHFLHFIHSLFKSCEKHKYHDVENIIHPTLPILHTSGGLPWKKNLTYGEK